MRPVPSLLLLLLTAASLASLAALASAQLAQPPSQVPAPMSGAMALAAPAPVNHHRNHKRHHRRTHGHAAPAGPQVEAPSRATRAHWQEDEASAQACPNCILQHQTQLKLSEQQQQQQQQRNMTSDSLRLEAIKYKILFKLGLKGKPNVTHAVPRKVAEGLVEEMMATPKDHHHHSSTTKRGHHHDHHEHGQEPDDFYGRASEIIAFAEPGHELNGQTLLEFSLAREEEGLPIQEATLWVRVDTRRSLRKVADRNLTLWVFRVHGKHFNTTHVSDEVFDSQTSIAGKLAVPLSDLGWKKLNLTRAVQHWYSEGSGSRGRLRLLVDCSGCGELVETTLFRPEGATDDRRRPFLVVKTEPPSKRVRRRAVACSGAMPGECCKQDLYVSFKDLGWDDWIIAPGGYRANYCRGNCSHYRTPDTYHNYHSHVLEEYRRLNKLVDMQPCCAPLRFSSMSLIYFDMDNNIIKRDLPKMVVEECGCP